MSHALHCPSCSAAIPPERIDVQQMVATCPNCGAVFNFADTVASARKSKRRKTKQPDYITHSADQHGVRLSLPLLTTRQNRIGYLALSSFILLIWLVAVSAIASDSADPAGLLFVTVLFVPMIAAFLLSYFVRQTITVKPDKLSHVLQLAGVPLYQRRLADGIYVDAHLEETSATRESTLPSRYNLFAQRADGQHDIFLQHLPEEMALYVQQALSDHLRAEDTAAIRLRDAIVDEAAQDDYDVDSPAQENSRR